jgi:hypothetical protein
MNAYSTMTARQRRQLAGLALLTIAVIITILAVVAPTAALVASLSLLAGGAILAALQTQRRVGRRTVAADVGAGSTAQPPLQIALADGAVRTARIVPLDHSDEHTLLLTRDGYLVVSAEGRVVHKIV